MTSLTCIYKKKKFHQGCFSSIDDIVDLQLLQKTKFDHSGFSPFDDIVDLHLQEKKFDQSCFSPFDDVVDLQLLQQGLPNGVCAKCCWLDDLQVLAALAENEIWP